MSMLRERFDSIVFDFGDTLATLEPPREKLCGEVLAKLGYGHSPETIRKAYSYTDFALKQKSSKINSETERQAFHTEYNNVLAINLRIESRSSEFDPLMQEHFREKKHWVIFPEVAGMLEKLKEQKFRLFVLANWDDSLLRLCKYNGIESFFDGIYSSRALGCEKPEPAIFNRFVALTGLKPETALYVGNEYLADVVGSRRCGFTPVLIDREGRASRDCDCRTVRSLEELVEMG